MTQPNPQPFLQILSRPYTVEEDGVFNSDPYDFKFELDSFQKHAINAIKRKENVLVTAHVEEAACIVAPPLVIVAGSALMNLWLTKFPICPPLPFEYPLAISLFSPN